MKHKKKSHKDMMEALGRIQNLAGKAKAAYMDDRSRDRWDVVVKPLEEIFNLAVEIRSSESP